MSPLKTNKGSKWGLQWFTPISPQWVKICPRIHYMTTNNLRWVSNGVYRGFGTKLGLSRTKKGLS